MKSAREWRDVRAVAQFVDGSTWRPALAGPAGCGYDVEVGGIGALRAGGFLQSEESHHAIQHAGLIARRRIELGQDVEALGDARDDADAEAARQFCSREADGPTPPTGCHIYAFVSMWH